jgi:hypothetical protein
VPWLNAHMRPLSSGAQRSLHPSGNSQPSTFHFDCGSATPRRSVVARALRFTFYLLLLHFSLHLSLSSIRASPVGPTAHLAPDRWQPVHKSRP